MLAASYYFSLFGAAAFLAGALGAAVLTGAHSLPSRAAVSSEHETTAPD